MTAFLYQRSSIDIRQSRVSARGIPSRTSAELGCLLAGAKTRSAEGGPRRSAMRAGGPLALTPVMTDRSNSYDRIPLALVGVLAAFVAVGVAATRFGPRGDELARGLP